MRRNSAYIDSEKASPSTSVATGIHDLHDNHQWELENKWPIVKKYISCQESTTTVNEGASMSFVVTTEGFADGHTLYYTINTVSGPAMNSDDFDGEATSGSFNLTSNAYTLNFTLTAEIDPGDAESNTFKLEIRSGSTGGTVELESAVVTVTDVIAYGEDIRTSFYEISNRFLNSQTYMGGSSADYNGPYDVGEVQQSYSGTVRVYLAHKVTALTTYYNDTPVAAVVHTNSSGTIQNNWIFHSSSGGTGSGWQTKNGQVYGTSAKMNTLVTPANAAAYTYQSMSTSANVNLWSFATLTGSSFTGAAGGISSSTTSYPVGNGQISQVGANYYAYRETSGATRWSSVFMRSPSITIASGDKLLVVHALTGPTSQSTYIDPTDSLWIGVY